MLKNTLLATLFALVFVPTSRATEGMWIPMLLESLNEADMQANGLRLSAKDIYDINSSSLKDAVVHFGGGCTAEVISDQGLILTNHHCGYSQIQSHSSVENDYLTDGFWAMKREDELQNPGLTATFIVRMENVTSQVLENVNDDMSEAKRNERIAKNIRALSKASVAGTHYEAYIRPFFYGNEYYMFITETFDDVRLVGAPPSSIGKFGYDVDNWLWPRHTGDFSIFRIYADADNKPAKPSADNKPYQPKHHFPVSLEGVKEGDFTMVYGFPGRTQQYLTSYAVDYVLNVSNPMKIKMRETSLSIIDADMKSSDKIRIQYAAKQSRISNAYKKWIGESRGLRKLNALEVKREREKQYMKLATQKNMTQYADLLKEFEGLYKEKEPYEFARDYWIEYWYYGPEIIRYASSFIDLVEGYEELEAKGELQEELDKRKKAAKGYFKNYNQPTDLKLFKAMTPMYANGVAKELAPEIFETVRAKYKGDWNEYGEDVFEKSVFTSEEKVNNMLNGFSKKWLKKLKKDPAYQLMLSIGRSYQGKVSGQRSTINNKIENKMRLYVRGMMELMPKNYWADANSTLRLTYGKVEGSTPRDGMSYKPFTTLEGVVEKYIPGDRDFDAPARLLELYKTKDYGQYGVDGTMPVCFTGSNHTTGGNSGSPVLNGDGHLIGLNFDRSWESTMSDIMYDPDRCRNIAVDIRYVLFIVDKFAGAGHLVDEMTIVTAEYREQQRQEKIKGEIQELTGMAKSNPQDATMFFRRGQAYEKLGNTTDALNDYNVALKMDSKYADAYLARAKVLAAMGKGKEAEKDFNQAIKLNAGSYEAWFERGLYFASIEQNTKAIKDFTKCTEINRNDYRAWYNRGICYAQMGKTREACSDLKFAEQLGGKKESQIYRALCGE